jgi:hypothetical protein
MLYISIFFSLMGISIFILFLLNLRERNKRNTEFLELQKID